MTKNTCVKKCYTSRQEAKRAIKKINQLSKGKVNLKDVYWCEPCQHWHTTSYSKEESRNYTRRIRNQRPSKKKEMMARRRYPIKKVYYEVYDNRAILEPIDGLTLLDRCTNKLRAIESAREWTGAVIRVERLVHSEKPLVSDILSTKLVTFFRPAPPEDAGVDRINLRTLRGRWTHYLGPDTRRRGRRR